MPCLSDQTPKLTYLKIVEAVLTLSLFLCAALFARESHAQGIKINEFKTTTTQAIELINISENTTNIGQWYLDDSSGNTYFTIPQDTQLLPYQCIVFQSDFNLNTASPDTVRLFDTTAPPNEAGAFLIDSYSYTTPPASGLSYSRDPDGSGQFQSSSPTFGAYNSNGITCTNILSQTTTPTPTPTFLPTPTPTPTPTPQDHLSPTPSISQTPTATINPTPSQFFNPSETPSQSPSPTTTTTPTMVQTISPTPTEAAYIDNIYISEVMVYPGSGGEWVELFNNNSTPFTIVDWGIDDLENAGGQVQRISGTLEPYGHLAFNLSGSLFNNDADLVRLIDGDDIELAAFAYTSSKINMSWGAREPISEQLFCIQSPSKGVANSACIEPTSTSTPQPSKTPTATKTPTPSPTPTPTKTTISGIYISEFLARTDAANPQEWVELYNDNSFGVSLENWSVSDSSDTSAEPVNLDIDPYRFTVIYFSSSRLNNDGDTVSLLDSQGKMVDSFTYSQTQSETSWGRKRDEFGVWCMQSPSKNDFNNICTSTPTNTPTRTPTPKRTSTPTRSPTPKVTKAQPPNQVSSSSSPSTSSSTYILGISNSRTTVGSKIIKYTPRSKKMESSDIFSIGVQAAQMQSVDEAQYTEPQANSFLFYFTQSPILVSIAIGVFAIVLGFTSIDLWQKWKEHSLSQYED